MSKNKLSVFCIIIGITTLNISYLSAAVCEDNKTGAYTAFANDTFDSGCARVIAPAPGGFQQACSDSFSGTLVSEECPVSCNACPGVCGSGVCEWDETYVTCPADCQTPPTCDSPVCLNITNLHPDVQTFDVIMKNQPGCTYYPTTTPTFDKNKTESECTTVGGVWFDGNIVGYQFVIKTENMTISASASAALTGGTAVDLEYVNTLNPDWARDSNSDGIPELSGAMFIGYTLDLTKIPPGEAALLTIKYTNYDNSSICFINDCTEACITVFVDDETRSPDVHMGDCYCPGSTVADCANVCGGNTQYDCTYEADNENTWEAACGGSVVEDCAGHCAGSATQDDGGCCVAALRDCAGVCGGNDESCLAIYQTSSNLPEEFSISQNFPNPFNPVTSISFDIATMDEISLVVYDLSGKEVITLASGTFTPGSYLVNWDAVNNNGDAISSGMYVYRYISSDKAITRKMLYLK